MQSIRVYLSGFLNSSLSFTNLLLERFLSDLENGFFRNIGKMDYLCMT